MCLTHFIAALPEPLHSTYEIVEGLAAGAYAVVYRVRDRETQEEFALKVIEKEPMRVRAMLPQVKREIDIAEEVAGSAHIVQLLEVTETTYHFFLRFELCQSSLDDLVIRDGPMMEQDAFQWLRQACLGVQELHASGIIHRDLKPQNFLIDASGSLSICDFGFACRTNEGLAGITGTPEYSPPETGKFCNVTHTEKADVYCLGASLQHLLLGRVPQDPQDMPKGMSPAAQNLLEDMMNPDPKLRPTIDDLLQASQLSQTLFSQWFGQWHVLLQGASGY